MTLTWAFVVEYLRRVFSNPFNINQAARLTRLAGQRARLAVVDGASDQDQNSAPVAVARPSAGTAPSSTKIIKRSG